MNILSRFRSQTNRNNHTDIYKTEVPPGLSPNDRRRFETVQAALDPSATIEDMRAALTTLGFTMITGTSIEEHQSEMLRNQLLVIRDTLVRSSIYKLGKDPMTGRYMIKK